MDMENNPARPVLLVAGENARSVAMASGEDWCSIAHVRDGREAMEWVHTGRPDTVMLDMDLPDMSGIAACRLLSGDPRIGRSVPILLVSSGPPSPEQRVAGLGAGAWDFVYHDNRTPDLELKLQTYVRAKRNIDVALAEGATGLAARVFDRMVLARRARELGALMARKHGALACLVFEPQPPLDEASVGHALALTARLSDVVGVWSPTALALVAPDTDDDGAVRLARRVTAVLEREHDATVPKSLAERPRIHIGYAAVANLTYRALDPLLLFVHASTAVRTGTPDARSPWVRRFDVSRASDQDVRAVLTPPDAIRTVS
jgi:CheY-like chemotaxis protein